MCVIFQWDGGVASLLGTIVHKPIFADVKISASRPAVPIVWLPQRQILVEEVVVGERPEGWLSLILYLLINSFFFVLQRLELSTVVMDDADSGFESKLQRPACNGKGILGILDAGSKDGVDIDIEFGVLGKPLKSFIKDFQAFCRNGIRLHVVNADLQVLKTGAVQPVNPVWSQQVPVGDEGSDHAVSADTANHFIQFRMQQRFTPAEGNDRCAESCKKIDAALHLRK